MGLEAVGLDAGTLLATLVAVCAVLAGLLTLTWVQNRSVPALGMWTACFIITAVAAVVLALRDRFPGFVGIDIANALRLLSGGLAWQAARNFNGRKGNWALVLAPAVIWIVACGLFTFNEQLRLRILVAAPLVAACAFAVASELWRTSSRSLWIARPAAVLLAIHGTIFVWRFFAGVLSDNSHLEVAGIAGPLHPVALLEALIIAVALGFLLLSAAKEEIGLQHREAALLDPLTGVSNRRGFEAEVRRMLARGARSGTPTALLLLDLDRFKTVNDRFGHPTGDRLLQALTETVTAQLRDGDVLGRLGGDEFAVALNNARIDQALILAERIRRAVAAMRVKNADMEVSFTVSVGVASLRDVETLGVLLSEADAALYRAKAHGSNRVEFVRTRHLLSEPGALPEKAKEKDTIKRVA